MRPLQAPCEFLEAVRRQRPPRRGATLMAARSFFITLAIYASIARAGTVGYWRFEESTCEPSGATPAILDSSGNELHGKAVGDPAYSRDVAPNATKTHTTQSLHFNGLSQQVLVPDHEKFQLRHSLTIEAFIKAEPMPHGTGGSGDILFRGDNRVGLDPYKLVVTRSGELWFHVESATASADLTSPIRYDQWMHVAGTLDDKTGAMKLYVNGVVVSSRITSVRPLGPLDPDYQAGVGIGSDQGSQYAELFSGWIDEVRLSDVALRPSQLLIGRQPRRQ